MSHLLKHANKLLEAARRKRISVGARAYTSKHAHSMHLCYLSTAFQLLWILVFSFSAFSQDKREYTLFNGARVYFTLDSDAPDTPSHLTSRIQVADLNAVNRILVDQKSGVFFGYTLKVEPIANSNQYRVFLQPLSDEQVTKIKSSKWYEQANDPKQAAANLRAGIAITSDERKPQPNTALTPITRYPPPQTIDDGDTIAVDVLVNPTTGTRLTDRVTITAKELPTPTATNKTARDFTLDDVELKVSNYRLFINNEMVTQDKPQAGGAGSLIWFYAPKHGRFIFSIQPRTDYGFQKIAMVDNNKITFSFAGNNYEWRSENPIISNGGKWNLWVLVDAQFQPENEEYEINLANKEKKITPVQSCCAVGFATNIDSLFNRTTAKAFYIAGEANLPGRFPFKEGTTLRQAIAMAQGTNIQSSARNAIISRQIENGNRQEIPVNIDNVVRGKEADVRLMANDIILIPRVKTDVFGRRSLTEEKYRVSLSNLLTPELYADELLIKHMLVDLPGAAAPESKWEVSWQVWFIPESEQKRVEAEIMLKTDSRTFAWNPRPNDFPGKIALANGVFNQVGLEQLQDRINISMAFPLKAKIPEYLQTKFASLMVSYSVKIFDAKLDRTISRSGIWMTKPFDDDPNNPLRSIPRTMLHSNWYVTESGEVFTSQEPRRSMNTKWDEQE